MQKISNKSFDNKMLNVNLRSPQTVTHENVVFFRQHQILLSHKPFTANLCVTFFEKWIPVLKKISFRF
jgi:hypothetical protein